MMQISIQEMLIVNKKLMLPKTEMDIDMHN